MNDDAVKDDIIQRIQVSAFEVRIALCYDYVDAVLENITEQDLLTLLAHKLGKQDKMLAVVEVEDYNCGDLLITNGHSYDDGNEAIIRANDALVVYNGESK